MRVDLAAPRGAVLARGLRIVLVTILALAVTAAILVFIPREKYDTDVRIGIGNYLANAYKGRLSASYAAFPEGPLARVHYIIGRYEGDTPFIERSVLEAGITAIATNWGDKLRAALAGTTDGMRARLLGNRYANAFTGGYPETFSTAQAIADIGERPVSTHRNLVTERGLAQIDAELDRLRKELGEAERQENRERPWGSRRICPVRGLRLRRLGGFRRRRGFPSWFCHLLPCRRGSAGRMSRKRIWARCRWAL